MTNLKKTFYSHIITIDSVILALSGLTITEQEKDELILLAEKSLHQVVLDTVLSELSEKDKKLFLAHLHRNEHDKIWELLHKTTESIENKIEQAVGQLTYELHKDIHDTRKK